jgi:transposase
MEDDERQRLLDENARLKAEVAVLKQTIDALCRRIFGKSSEKLDPAQLELFDPAKKAPAAESADPGPAAEEPARRTPRHKQPRAPRIPDHLPVDEQVVDPPKVLANPEQCPRVGSVPAN